MNLESGVTVSLETVARNLAGGRGIGRAPGVKDEGALATALEYFQKCRWGLGECKAHSRWAPGSTG